MSVNEIRRRVDALRERVTPSAEVRLRERLERLTENQRKRYDAHLIANDVQSYEELLDGIADAPRLDADIECALFGPNWRVNVDDTERSAADKWHRYKERTGN